NKDEYVAGVLTVLKQGGPDADMIREAVRQCFRIGEPLPPDEKKSSSAPKKRLNKRGHKNV
ncbi:MAG: hypothetical protein K2J78_03285, partial [Muribaculaceae bacterium]|nr:hypothetical protein [Muribaculaceae bacterium]